MPTEIWGPTWLTVTWSGTSDYTISTPILLRSIRFYGTVNDVLCVRQVVPGESNKNNWPHFKLVAFNNSVAMFEPMVGNRPTKAKYCIDYSNSSFADPNLVVINFVYE